MDTVIANIVIIAVLAVIVAGTVWYLVRAKLRGDKCIGCPYSKQCGGKCGCKKSDTSHE
ncbi:MAG: FeoB-associated Cys-rich membrane protein [Clostridia bacterium]|nr:FeoB-associated Cys-rich membrane protein [Clostridia bacterium]